MGARRPTNKNNYKLNPNEGTETETIIDDNPDSQLQETLLRWLLSSKFIVSNY